MKKSLAILCLAATLALPTFANAEAEKIEHYEGQEIASSQEAITILQKDSAKITELLDGSDINDTVFETIHEMSYTLENATDKLIALEYTAQPKLDALDEAVQAIHHASESHEGDKVKEWAPKLANAITELQNTSSDQIALADEPGTYTLTLKNHKFDKEELRVPAGEKFKIIVKNMDPTPEEFESDDFRREKIIAGNSEATIHVGPLKPGQYEYFGEFNLDTAKGILIAE
jgi:hypothetical protein